MKFSGICLYTCDVPRLAEFYRQALGVKSDDPANEVHQVILAEGPMLAIWNSGSNDAGNPNMNLAFDVEDVDAEFRRLVAMGVKILQPPTDQPWGMRNCVFQDVDSNRVAFRSPV